MNGYRILVVEDDQFTSTLLEKSLEKLGHAVCGSTASGSEALALVRDLAPDLVFMDVNLEGSMNGVEAARAIAENSHIPIIFLTADSAESVSGAYNIPSTACFIKKPFRNEELQANIELSIRHHRLEATVRKNERRYRSLFDNALAGIYVMDLDGKLLTVNATLAHMMGYASEAEMLDTVRNVHQQFYTNHEAFPALVKALGRDKELVRYETRVFGKDGDMLWLSQQLRLVPDADNGHHEVILGLAVDITERRAMQAELETTMNMLRQTIDALPDPMVLTDLDLNTILANETFEKQFHPQCAESCTPLFERLDQAEWDRQQAQFLEKPGVYRFVVPDEAGSIAFLAAMSPYRDLDGQLIGAIYSLTPVGPRPGE